VKLADTLPFSRELTAPPHNESFRRPEACLAPGEVEIDKTWSVTTASDSRIAEKAANHLVSFLNRALSVHLAENATDRNIILRTEPALDQNGETHRLQVDPDRIEVIGAGPEGILKGVFRLEALMRERGGPFLPLGEEQRRPLFKRRIHRSALSPFYVEELTGYDGPPFQDKWRDIESVYPAYTEEDAGPQMFYHDNLLSRLAEHGFNGIWVRGVLRHFAKVEIFPEFGERSDAILAELRQLVERAAEHGISVFLYINEPMGIDEDDPFWEKYPQCRGITMESMPVSCLCTTAQEVKQYLRQASEYVFAQVPGLAGMILITASEYPSHCYCHYHAHPDEPAALTGLSEGGKICPRCASRTPQEVVAEIIGLLRDGAKAANPQAEVIAWNWSWSFYEEDPQTGILERLPKDVVVMGGFERGEPTSALGFEYINDEYSIKIVGPSQRFRGTLEYQKQHGRPIYAKLQLGTTHENPTVPYLPALHKIAAKYKALQEHGVAGMMTCWNFGNMPSLATEVANEFSWDPQPELEEGLLAVARRNFGPDAAEHLVAGWKRMSEAIEDFPGSIPVLYYGPVSRGPAFSLVFDLVARKFPRTWLLDIEVEADQLDWTTPFGPEKVMECYQAVAEGWSDGIDRMEEGLPKAQGADRTRLVRAIGVARMYRIQLLSAANVVDFLLTRNAMYENKDPQQKRELLNRLEQICRNEIANARSAIPLCEADSRLGFHGEAYGYMFNKELIEQKLAALEEIVSRRIPEYRSNG